MVPTKCTLSLFYFVLDIYSEHQNSEGLLSISLAQWVILTMWELRQENLCMKCSEPTVQYPTTFSSGLVYQHLEGKLYRVGPGHPDSCSCMLDRLQQGWRSGFQMVRVGTPEWSDEFKKKTTSKQRNNQSGRPEKFKPTKRANTWQKNKHEVKWRHHENISFLWGFQFSLWDVRVGHTVNIHSESF